MTPTDLIRIAEHLQTRYQPKKHGGYDIYEDEYLIIKYDTYYPNIEVSIKDKNKHEILVYSRSGNGHVYEHHPGFWQNYINEILTPRACEAEVKHGGERELREREEHARRFGPVDDADVFGAVV